MSISLSYDTLLGDECICDGRCKECVIVETEKHCKLCSGYYGLDFKNLGIDSYNSENNLQLPRRTCVCPANYNQMSSGNHVSYASSEVVFVRLECGYYPIDDRFCVGINPQIFFIGINFADYWIIIGSILSILLILCCAVYSLLKNNWCFSSQQLITMYGQNFPLSTVRHSRIGSSNSFSNDNQFTELGRESSLPPTYDEVINTSISCNSNSNLLGKHLINVTIIDGNDHLPTYEDAVRNIKIDL